MPSIPRTSANLGPVPKSSIRRSSSASIDDGPQCPITLEPIATYGADDVFTTLDGVSYHRPSLKIWLQSHDTLPHRGIRASEEIVRLWPAQVNTSIIPWHGILLEGIGRNLALASVPATMVTLLGLAMTDSPAETRAQIRHQAHEICRSARYARCVSDTALQLLEAQAIERRPRVDAGLSGATVVMVLLGGVLCASGQGFRGAGRALLAASLLPTLAGEIWYVGWALPNANEMLWQQAQLACAIVPDTACVDQAISTFTADDAGAFQRRLMAAAFNFTATMVLFGAFVAVSEVRPALSRRCERPVTAEERRRAGVV